MENHTFGQIITGLSKISQTLKTHAWTGSLKRGLTPTQGQILAFLGQRQRGEQTFLSDIAKNLGITMATISEAVQSLVDKGFVVKQASLEDKRYFNVILTDKGKEEVGTILQWPDFLFSAIHVLSDAEQETFLVVLLKMIRELQNRGEIPVSRMCVTCQYFQPNIYQDKEKPHHCKFVDEPFGNKQLRLNCSDHQEAQTEQAQEAWAIFTSQKNF